MSRDLMKKYAMIVEDGQSTRGTSAMATSMLLDQLEELLNEAGEVCRQLERDPIVGRTVGAYTRPWLQAWIDGRHQSGSVEDLRDTLARHSSEGDDEDDEDDGSAAYAARINR